MKCTFQLKRKSAFDKNLTVFFLFLYTWRCKRNPRLIEADSAVSAGWHDCTLSYSTERQNDIKEDNNMSAYYYYYKERWGWTLNAWRLVGRTKKERKQLSWMHSLPTEPQTEWGERRCAVFNAERAKHGFVLSKDQVTFNNMKADKTSDIAVSAGQRNMFL